MSLSTLQPQAVWQWFDQFCAIPHPTFHEQKLGAVIVQKAQEKGLAVQQDEKGNILIQKPGTKGLEDRPIIAMQAHIDMVPQKGTSSQHNFETDPIQTSVKEGWVFANDTTLGADNGIGASMALAVAFSDDIPHPPIDIVLTVEEETGMGGAKNINPDWLRAPYLVNLDSEDEGILFIGCAGGRDATFSFPFVAEPVTGKAYRIQVAGLKGGHSGIDIDSGRGNANLLLIRVLDKIAQHGKLRLINLQGGSLRNVITREAFADIVYTGDDIEHCLNTISSIIKDELSVVEPMLEISANELTKDSPLVAISEEQSQRIIRFIRVLPNGVIRMSDSFEGVVETSISLGVLTVKEDKLSIRCLMRSLLETPKDDVSNRLQALAKLVGVELVLSGDYPGWKPEPQSLLLSKCKALFNEFYGKEPAIEVMHAGLECGILKGRAPHMEMISFGPNIRAAHSPKECVEISSVDECWKILLRFLENSPEK